jgi:tripartite-type tricarboxylate transporter receptor subunit TctC
MGCLSSGRRERRPPGGRAREIRKLTRPERRAPSAPAASRVRRPMATRSSSATVNGATYTLPFDVVKDFEPISLVADCPVWFVAKASLPQKDLRELITWMKENPGKATVGIGGIGGGADVVGTYFQKNTGTRFPINPAAPCGSSNCGMPDPGSE